MAETEVPHLNIEISEENLMDGFAKIAEFLRPGWKPDQIQMKDISCGFINRNYHCFIPGDREPVLLRIINTNVTDLIQRVHNSMRYLKRRQLGAQLLLTFTNGLVMEFIEGEPITWLSIDRVKEPEIWLSYAREMAKFHATTNEEDAKKFNIPIHNDNAQRFISIVQNGIASGKITEEHLKGLPTVEQMFEWKEMIYKQLIDAGAETKFCHMDPNPTNLIITEDKSVVIVDYDDCLMDLPCMEMAVGFVELCGVVDFSTDKLPSEEQKDLFLREYLKTRHEIEQKGAVSETTVEFWKFLLRKAHLRALLSVIVIVLALQIDTLTDKPIDVRICHGLWELYKQDKEKILAETFPRTT